MDVWIIIRGSWDNRTIMGVVHSRDAADALTATTQFLDQYDSEKLHAQGPFRLGVIGGDFDD